MKQKGVEISFANYCKSRKEPDANECMLFLEEVNSQCPKCGKPFLYSTAKSIMKGAEIAHVFPNSPTPKEKIILKDVEVDGDSSEAFENKIALCKDCHDNYDANKTVESYNDMLDLKRRLHLDLLAKKMMSGETIEKELTDVVLALSTASTEELDDMGSLNYASLKVSQKIELPLLCKRIEGDVTSFYPYCRQKFKDIDASGSRFEIICMTIRRAYLKLKDKGLGKEEIFEQLSNWLVSKTHSSKNACEIMVSFFVQNCDVYDEISE